MSNARRVRLAMIAGTAVIALSQGVYSQQSSYRIVEDHFKLPEGGRSERRLGSPLIATGAASGHSSDAVARTASVQTWRPF